jgi:hypothetical protein
METAPLERPGWQRDVGRGTLPDAGFDISTSPGGMIPLVSEHHVDLEVVRLNLAQIAAAPDTWRARAVAAGGFLGAAAAVSLWGLSQQAARFDGLVVFVSATAAVLYVLAVIGFLVASVWPTPKLDANAVGTLADQLHGLALKETKPIKAMVLTAAGLGSLAIGATTLGTFIILLSPVRSEVLVSFTADEQRAALQRMCPGIPDPFWAKLTDDGSGQVRLEITSSHCGKGHPELTVPRGAALLLNSDSRD